MPIDDTPWWWNEARRQATRSDQHLPPAGEDSPEIRAALNRLADDLDVPRGPMNGANAHWAPATPVLGVGLDWTPCEPPPDGWWRGWAGFRPNVVVAPRLTEVIRRARIARRLIHDARSNVVEAYRVLAERGDDW